MKKRVSILIFVVSFFWTAIASGQVPDSTQNVQPTDIQSDTLPSIDSLDSESGLDSNLIEKKRGFVYRLFKEDYPNPKKALFISLAIPGGGQFYNRRWWKVPIIYAGYGALIYSASYNGKNYRRFRDAVIAEYKDEPHSLEFLNLSVSDLERLRDQFDKRKQLSYIGIFALHLVQTAEAFVDCHLKSFDVSDDLSMQVKPSLQAVPQGYGLAPGLGVSFTIK